MKQLFRSTLRWISVVAAALALAIPDRAEAQDGNNAPLAGDNFPPEVRLVTPENGAKFFAPATIQLLAQASDRDGTVRTVEFFANERSLGTTTNNPLSASPVNPFQLAWTNVPPGEYALRAKATDDRGASAFSATAKVTVSSVPPQAEVNVVAAKPEATEQGDARSRTLIFRFVRSGSRDIAMPVFYSVHGTATAGEDFAKLSGELVIPQGAEAAELSVEVFDDALAEPDESVVIRVEPPHCIQIYPPPPECYRVGPRSEAKGVIAASDQPPSDKFAVLQITAPKEGAELRSPATVRIELTAIDPLGDIRLVEFFANGRLIGKSEHLTRDAVIPGKPRFHVFDWNSVSPGRYEIVAKARETSGAEILSQAVRFTVVGNVELVPPVVSIEAVIHETGEPSPLAIVRPGRFQIHVRGGTGDSSLPVFLEIGGTAKNGEDYKKLERWVVVPSHTNSFFIDVVALDDAVVEADESVEVKLTTTASNDFPLDIPIRRYAVNPERPAARVLIRDNDRPTTTAARLEITSPKDGQKFVDPAAIEIHATAVDPSGYISRVEFYAGDRRIGVSEITFIRAPDPGTPIAHTFVWKQPPPGTHVLTALAVASTGAKVVSRPVTISVHRASDTPNQAAAVTIVRPSAGAQAAAGTPIEIVVEARDPDGYVPKMEFFVDEKKIGEQNIAFIQPPPPGDTQRFEFVWREPAPGSHVLTARGTDDRGKPSGSRPVEIKVSGDSLPIVSLSVTDALAIEPAADATNINTAAFVIRRDGSTNAPLTVRYSVHGTAQNGIDYEKLSGEMVIPAGQTSATLIVRPIHDKAAEQPETVILQLESAAQYRLRDSRRVAVLIHESGFFRTGLGLGESKSSLLADGSVHLSMPAERGRRVRVEVSTNLLNWETVSEATAAEDGVHIVDEKQGAQLKFYRVVPEEEQPAP